MSHAEKMKVWIDNATYRQLLERWRSAPIGSPWFSGEVGDYYVARMAKAREETTHEEKVTASKDIGWGGSGYED